MEKSSFLKPHLQFRLSGHKAALFFSILFAIGLLLYEQAVLPFRSHEFVEQLHPAPGILIQGASVFGASLFFFAALTSAKRWRILYLILFILSILTEYGYCYAMGRFSLPQDFMIGFQALDINLIRSAAVSFLGGRYESIAPIVLFSILLTFFPGSRNWGPKQFVLVLLSLILLFSLIYPFSRGTYPTLSISASWRTLTFTGWKVIGTYRGERERVAYTAVEKPDTNIVFVIDESVRCDHLSLNGYERDTTPYLKELRDQGILFNWGNASAGGTVSLTSNVLLAAGTTRLPDPDQTYLKEPTIFQYAKAAGYETYLVDAQMNNLWQLKQSDLADVDHWFTASQFQVSGKEYVDFEVAKTINNLLKGDPGKFIWINKMGVHFHYAKHYPPESARWPAEPYSQYDPSQAQLIRDNYDSALAFNIDSFFKHLLEGNILTNTAIVYTSDHGQTLTENGATWPHNGNSRSEACVPLFIISQSNLEVDTSYPASHFNLFPTLLDLMNIPQQARHFPYALSLLKARASDASPRYYLTGSLDSRFGSVVYPFDPGE